MITWGCKYSVTKGASWFALMTWEVRMNLFRVMVTIVMCPFSQVQTWDAKLMNSELVLLVTIQVSDDLVS